MKTFPRNVEVKLGFDTIRERLLEMVRSPLGEDRLAQMRLSGNLDRIRAELERVSELQQVFRFDDSLPLRDVIDVRPVLDRTAPAGSMADPEELLSIGRVLATLRLLRRFFDARSDKYPRLMRLVLRITPAPDLEERLREVVDDDGRVRDSASPELTRLRRLIIRKQAALRETLQRELRAAMREGYATEEQPTIRNGRMVIPVRAEAKRKIQGFVQDASASGQTVYIEPAACLDLNNEVRELQGEERREVERILREATARVRDRLDELREGIGVLAAFDLLQAKARFSNEINAVIPDLNDEGIIEVVEGRNPVLQLHFREPEREVVPLNLHLGERFRTLVITGPNAGGKTVAMKTVGLFALMLAYGFPLPLDEKSRFSAFKRLHVDIGDEQSIEEDLSTFSSHVSNLKYMLQHAGRETLILIDEAGTGTDPAEGGALAQAVLEQLTERGSRTIATTHHGTLKVFAHETEGVENGSMEFDQATLSPTYRFQPGIPGSSYAFEIASRIGLDGEILERARSLVGEQKTSLEELITTFESRSQQLEAQLAEAKQEAARSRHERHQYEARARKLEREREEIRRQALEEAERIVAEANARIERTIREIKEAQAEQEATRSARRKLESFREEVNRRIAAADGSEAGTPAARPDETVRTESAEAVSADTGMEPADDAREGSPAGGRIEVGDQVVLDDGSTTAEVLEIDEGEAVISFDSMRLRADVERLTKVGGKRRQQVRVGTIEQSRGGSLSSFSARSRIDLRGKRVDEALEEVTRLIDDAVMSGFDDLEILHGKGTGALRQAIHEYLAERDEVVTFEEAPWDQGGAGVTYVRLR